MPSEKQVWVFVAFLDIRGFGAFVRRVSHYESEFLPYRRAWRDLIDKFEKRTGYFVKRLGDGVMIVREVDRENTSQASTEFLNNTWCLFKKSESLTKRKRSPRPEGVAIRNGFGIAWKEPCKQFGHDYVADKINLTEKTIHWNRTTCFAVHESFKEELTDYQCKKQGFRFKRIERDKNLLDQGPYETDTKLLWEFRKVR